MTLENETSGYEFQFRDAGWATLPAEENIRQAEIAYQSALTIANEGLAAAKRYAKEFFDVYRIGRFDRGTTETQNRMINGFARQALAASISIRAFGKPAWIVCHKTGEELLCVPSFDENFGYAPVCHIEPGSFPDLARHAAEDFKGTSDA